MDGETHGLLSCDGAIGVASGLGHLGEGDGSGEETGSVLEHELHADGRGTGGASGTLRLAVGELNCGMATRES